MTPHPHIQSGRMTPHPHIQSGRITPHPHIQFEIRVKEKDQYLRSQNLSMFRPPEFIWIPPRRLSIL